MADSPEIKVKLTAEDTGVSAAIKELTSQLKTLKKQQDETAGSGFSLAKAFQGIAAAGALLELGRIGKDAFESAINIGKMADKTGLSTEALSVFHHVAEELGVSTESVDKALIRGAKSITEFQLGGAKAAQGFKILGITQKDFVGLKSDEKIALITTRLGGMAAGFQKATAAQLIFSRGGAEFIPVANAIAGEGFDKVTASAARLGLLFSRDFTNSAQIAKASLQELKAAGVGATAQFEAGLLPAVTDVAFGLVRVSENGTKSSDAFKIMGEKAGVLLKGTVGVFDTWFHALDQVGAVIELVGGLVLSTFEAIGRGAFAAADAIRFHFSQAGTELKGIVGSYNSVLQDFGNATRKTWEDNRKFVEDIFPSAAEAARRRAEELKNLRPENQTEPQEISTAAAPTDAAARAALALLEKQLQDELAIHRAYAKQTEQVDAEMFEKGELSLKEYFDRRKTAVTADAVEEVEILRHAVDAANAEAQKAALAKQKAGTPKDADKQEAARLQALTKVEELQTKISEIQINASTKIQALDTEEFKKRADIQTKILEFEKLVDTSAGKRLEAAKAEIAIEQQKLALILAQSGASQAEIDKELARYAQVKTAEVEFIEQQKGGADALKLLADQRAEIDDKVRTGQLFEVQGAEQIRQLELARLPVLQQIADQLLAQAKATGDEEKITQAEDFQKQVNQISVQANTVGQQIATIKQGLQSSITGGFTQFFGSLVQGTQSVGQAFRGLASSVTSSLAQIAAQMLAQLILTKLLKAALGGFSGGGLVPGVGGGAGHAEGGLIRGPGGPKSDSIPARLSPGEYIVKADAVSAVGVQYLEAINRGLKIPSFERLALPKFAEGGLVGNGGGGGGDSNINLGIGLDEGLILKHLSSKAAGNIIVQHLANNPKAASKALSRSD
jgi:hypothetical protein